MRKSFPGDYTTQSTQYLGAMLSWFWASVVDVGTTLNQHWYRYSWAAPGGTFRRAIHNSLCFLSSIIIPTSMLPHDTWMTCRVHWKSSHAFFSRNRSKKMILNPKIVYTISPKHSHPSNLMTNHKKVKKIIRIHTIVLSFGEFRYDAAIRRQTVIGKWWIF